MLIQKYVTNIYSSIKFDTLSILFKFEKELVCPVKFLYLQIWGTVFLGHLLNSENHQVIF